MANAVHHLSDVLFEYGVGCPQGQPGSVKRKTLSTTLHMTSMSMLVECFCQNNVHFFSLTCFRATATPAMALLWAHPEVKEMLQSSPGPASYRLPPNLFIHRPNTLENQTSSVE